jgi:hypothetical protein
MKPSRLPQLALRLDAATTATDAPWRAGGTLAYLGGTLTLVLDTAARTPVRLDRELHLPLPPAATPRQIRDAAESWLRDEAQRVFTAALQKSALARRHLDAMPRVVLVFGRRSDWVKHESDLLRCHWRLVEQPLAVVEQVLDQALAKTQPTQVSDDLFALV